MRSPIRALVLAVALCVTLSATPTMAAPQPPEYVDITLHSGESGPVLLVSGVLPESVKLPAQMELSMPRDAELQWVGEILGGESSKDPEAKYTTRVQGDHSVYTLTLTKSRTGQIEAIYPTGYGALGTGQLAASVSWTPSQDVSAVRVAVSIPAGANILAPIEGAQMSPPESGGAFYYREYEKVKAGKPLTFSFAFEQGAVGSAAQPKQDSLVPVILVIVGVVVAVIMLMAVRRKMQLRNGVLAEDEEFGSLMPEDASEAPVVAVEAEAGEDMAEAAAPVAASGGRQKALVVTGALVLVFVVAMVVSANVGRSTRAFGDEMVREYAQGDACTAAQIQLSLPAGDELKPAADKVFAALDTGQIIKATLNTETQVLKVDFCESSTSEEAIRAALEPLGVLSQ